MGAIPSQSQCYTLYLKRGIQVQYRQRQPSLDEAFEEEVAYPRRGYSSRNWRWRHDGQVTHEYQRNDWENCWNDEPLSLWYIPPYCLYED